MNADELKELTFRGPVRFLDGRKGMAQQDFECVTNPRFGYSWRRETHTDQGRQFYTVDGAEVADLDEAALKLTLPVDPLSPAERQKRSIDSFKASPKLYGRATRAESEAKCNASVGPMGSVRAWMVRISDAWHRGINQYADQRRKAGAGFDDYKWLYRAKDGAHEIYRLIYSFGADRRSDTRLVCALGVRCRDCPILLNIESAMLEARNDSRWPKDIDDQDIDAAKAWTCVSHILSERGEVMDGVFVVNNRDREERGR